MLDKTKGDTFSYTHKARDLDHEEIGLPPDAPEWTRALVEGRSVAKASEAIWNFTQEIEFRSDAQLAREVLLALPVELSLDQKHRPHARVRRNASNITGHRRGLGDPRQSG